MFKIVELFIEILNWIKIVLSPLLIGGIIGALVYFNFPGIFGFTFSIVIVLTGLMFGVVWATREWKKQGTNNFMSRVIASPELDKTEKEQDQKKNDLI